MADEGWAIWTKIQHRYSFTLAERQTRHRSICFTQKNSKWSSWLNCRHSKPDSSNDEINADKLLLNNSIIKECSVLHTLWFSSKMIRNDFFHSETSWSHQKKEKMHKLNCSNMLATYFCNMVQEFGCNFFIIVSQYWVSVTFYPDAQTVLHDLNLS